MRRLAAQKLQDQYVPDSELTGTVWDNIATTANDLPNTNIPATFRIKTGSLEFYVNSNATKHMQEYLEKTANPINGQSLLSSFASALDEITQTGLPKFNHMYEINGWEIMFNQRDGDILPVIKHALYIP